MTVQLAYIVGAGHSGSTLLGILLGNHPRAATFGELSSFDHVVRCNLRCTCGETIWQCPFWVSVIAAYAGTDGLREIPDRWPTDTRRNAYTSSLARLRYLFLALGLTWTPWVWGLSLVRTISPDACRRATNAWCCNDAIRAAARKSVVVDTSKSAVRMRLLHAHRPQCIKTIFLTRDVRAVSASLTRRVATQQPSPSERAREWVRANRLALASLRALPREDCLHVTYEGLCRESEATLTRAYRFLGLSVSDKPHRIDSEALHLISGNPMRFRGVPAIREDLSWRVRLSSRDLARVEQIAGALNRRLLGDYYVA